MDTKDMAERIAKRFTADDDNVVSMGFAIITPESGILDDNAQEKVEAGEADEWIEKGWVNEEGEFTREGEDKLTEDLMEIESNVLDWLKKTFESARDEGHDNEALIGSLFVNLDDSKQVGVLENTDEAGGDLFINNADTEIRGVFDGTSDLSRVVDVDLEFFDIPEEAKEKLDI